MGCGMSSPKNKNESSHQLQHYNPVHYASDQIQIRHPNRIVTHVHFIAQTILQTGGNHWVMFLQTGSKESVRINMDPSDMMGAQISGHGYRGRMEITHRNHAMTRTRQYTITIVATPGHSVAEFIDAIVQVGNHEYDFTTTGRGCTGWMLDQYHLFLQIGLLQPQNNQIEDMINSEWMDGRRTRQWPATRGFYMRDTRGGGWSRRRAGTGASGGRAGQGGANRERR